VIRFWGREIVGWLLIALGLAIFYIVIDLLLRRGPEILLDGHLYTIIGIFVFRGGIHLLKVAVAARIAMQVEAEAAAPTEKPTTTRETPWDW